jgi:predicted 3-demethylubiquinone-9 3-methyltransferase (glyoxalase superfamily)
MSHADCGPSADAGIVSGAPVQPRREGVRQKITPCLWFDGRAEEAVKFYTSVFKRSKKGDVTRYGEAGPGAKGSVMTATFTIEGQEFMALNGGPEFKFSPAVSFIVHAKSQKRVDYYWDRLLEGGGAPQQCGWLTDRFGVSWQVVPAIVPELMRAKDKAKRERVMQAILKMVKLDVKALKRAARGPAAAKGRPKAKGEKARQKSGEEPPAGKAPAAK